jgi:PAS domain S-box-containing protein
MMNGDPVFGSCASTVCAEPVALGAPAVSQEFGALDAVLERLESELECDGLRQERVVAEGAGELPGANRQLQADIGAGTRGEQQPHSHEAMLQLALEAAAMGAWEYDLRSQRISHSANQCKLYGVKPREGVCPRCFFLDWVHPEDLESVTRGFDAALATGKDEVRVEFRVRGFEGGQRWFATRCRIERNAQGRPLRLIGIDADVTTEHDLRARLQRSNEELERFAYTVAHDLKTPLRTLVGFMSLVARSASPRLSASERDLLQRAAHAGQEMSELIDGVLEFARASRIQERKPVDLAEVFEHCLLRLEAEIEAVGAVISRDPLPTVLGSRALLLQALQNLLANALKYRAQRRLHVHVGARWIESAWVVSVRDNGIGIAPESQARLFDAFVRAHADAGYPGLGLGLALVKGAAAYHLGSVWLESTLGEGSTFSFSLPQPADAAGH